MEINSLSEDIWYQIFCKRHLPKTVYLITETAVILTGNLNQSEAYALIESISQPASPCSLAELFITVLGTTGLCVGSQVGSL